MTAALVAAALAETKNPERLWARWEPARLHLRANLNDVNAACGEDVGYSKYVREDIAAAEVANAPGYETAMAESVRASRLEDECKVLAARLAEVTAERDVLRGTYCGEVAVIADGVPQERGPCGVCIKCLRAERDAAVALTHTARVEGAAEGMLCAENHIRDQGLFHETHDRERTALERCAESLRKATRWMVASNGDPVATKTLDAVDALRDERDRALDAMYGLAGRIEALRAGIDGVVYAIQENILRGEGESFKDVAGRVLAADDAAGGGS